MLHERDKNMRCKVQRVAPIIIHSYILHSKIVLGVGVRKCSNSRKKRDFYGEQKCGGKENVKVCFRSTLKFLSKVGERK